MSACVRCHGTGLIPLGIVPQAAPCDDCGGSGVDRDTRQELPTRMPCPFGSDFQPSHNCWLCNGAGVHPTAYRAWVAAGKPKDRPEKWPDGL